MIELEDDGRYSCRHSFVEETDYDWFASTDGEKVVLPIDDDKIPMMPVVMCFVDPDGKESEKAHGCYGRSGCKFYDRVIYE